MWKFFPIIRIRLIWLDAFVERVNREEKSHADWTNRHILKQNREEKNTKLSISSLLIKSLWLKGARISACKYTWSVKADCDIRCCQFCFVFVFFSLQTLLQYFCHSCIFSTFFILISDYTTATVSLWFILNVHVWVLVRTSDYYSLEVFNDKDIDQQLITWNFHVPIMFNCLHLKTSYNIIFPLFLVWSV